MRRALAAALIGSLAGIAGTLPAAAQNCAPSFSFKNESGKAVREVYVDLATAPASGANRLGTETIAPGTTWSFKPENAYRPQNVKVVLADGAIYEWKGADLCSFSVFRITAKGLER
jgi:hypothetical protein